MPRPLPLIAAILALSLSTFGALAQSAPPPPPAPVPPAPVPEAHTVSPFPQLFAPALVTFSATQGEARLEQELRGGEWVPVCEAPCRVALDPRGLYHVDGPGLSTSRELRFSPGPVTVETRPGPLGAKVGGIVATSAGGGMLLAALAFEALAVGCFSDSCSHTHDTDTSNLRIGLVAVGALALASGVVLLLHGRTDVTVGDGAVSLGGGARLSARGVSF